MKYHIRDSGEPGPCVAAAGACPLGEESAHYSSESEAREAAERQLSEEYGLYRQDYCGCEFSAKARGIEK